MRVPDDRKGAATEKSGWWQPRNNVLLA